MTDKDDRWRRFQEQAGPAFEKAKEGMRDFAEKAKPVINEGMAQAREGLGRVADEVKQRAKENTAAAMQPGFVPVREHPKGTREFKNNAPGTVRLQFKAARRFWWRFWFLFVFACCLAPVVGAGLGSFLAVAGSRSLYVNLAAASFQGGFFTTLICVGAAVIFWNWSRPWVEVYADRSEVRVENLRFDRRNYGGFQMGYTINTGEAMMGNDFHDLDLGLVGLRLVYGPYGEDLPWLVNKYHSQEIAIWLTYKIAEATRPQQDPGTLAGERPQNF